MRTLLAFVLLCSSAFAATATREDFAPQAPVILCKSNGTQIPYGTGAATDIARGTALIAATNAAVAGDVIRFGPGTFDCVTTQVNLPDNVSLVGSDRFATILKSNIEKSTDGVAVSPGDNSLISSFTLDTRGNQNTIAIGAQSLTAHTDKEFEGVVVRDLYWLGDIDIFQVYHGTGAASGQVYEITFEDCSGDCDWDHISVNTEAGTPTTTVTLRNCHLLTTGTSFTQTVACTAISGSATINIYGGSITTGAGTIVSNSVNASHNITVNLHDVAIATTGTSAKNLYQSNTGVINVYGGRGSGTDGAYTTTGTINYVASGRLVSELASKSSGAYTKKTAQLLLSDPNGAAISTGDGIGGLVYRVPAELNGWNLVGVAANVTTASSSGAVTVQVYNATDSADMLSTAITIDASETDTATAATAAVINTSTDDVATADKIRFDVDGAGTGTKGLSVTLTFQAP